MSFNFASLLPAVGAIAGSVIAPGVGTAIGGALGSALAGSVGGGGSSAAGGMIGGGLAQMLTSEQVRKYLEDLQQKDQQRWADTLRINHPNQVGFSGQSSTWSQDPGGTWTQTLKLSPQDQALRDKEKSLKMPMLEGAGKLGAQLAGMGGIDWESLGLGKMGQAATGRAGTSDKFGSITEGNSWNMIPYMQGATTGTGAPLGGAGSMTPPAVQKPTGTMGGQALSPQLLEMMRGGY
jgi:hypothetical protein